MPSIAIPVSLRGQLLNSVRAAPAAFSPSTLFALNEPGVWYDPSDVANLAWRRNLLTFTEQFDNAAWTKTNVNVTPNFDTAPDGTLTADRVSPTSGNSSIRWSGVVVGNASSITGSVWLRSVSGSVNVSVYVGRGDFGSVTTVPVTLTTTWQRVSGTFVSDGSIMQLSVGGFSTLETGEDILIWGAQLELGSVATDYQRISDVNTEVIERFPTATLFQDTAGTTPVTTPGQTVALALDKSKGLVLGSELVANGTFDTDTSGWTASNSTLSVVDGKLRVTNVGAANGTGYQSFSTTIGKTYKYTVTATAGTSSALPRIGTAIGGAQYGSGSLIFTATATTAFVSMRNATAVDGAYADYDNISVKELPGFHATQATLASRPTYGIVPLGGRRNLLERTEEFDNAYWTKSGVTVTANAAAAPDATTTADKLVEAAAAGNHRLQRSFTSTTGVSYAFSCYAKAAERSWIYLYDDISNSYAYFDVANGVKGTIGAGWTSSTIQSVGNGWYRISAVATEAAGGAGAQLIGVANANNGFSYTGDGTSGILIWGAQLETGSSATAYQRVTTGFDVTEAGVASLSYLSFDGVDDFLITPTITPGIDKVTVGAGLRKLSDVAQGMIYEHGFDSDVFLIGPLNTGVGNYGFRSAGTLSSTASASGFAAPVTNVVTGLGDISADLATLRVNGSQVAQATADQGTGNYTPQISYIGRRQGTSLPFNGQLYSLVVRFAVTDVATVGQLESWINEKTGAYS